MFIKILFFLAKIAPFRVFQAFGSFLGFLMVFSNSKSLKTSSTNLKHVFKSKTKEEIDDLSRGQHFGPSYVELYNDVIQELDNLGINYELFKNNWLEIKERHL